MKSLLIGLSAVVLGLAAGALLMLATGNDPAAGYLYLFSGGLMSFERLFNTLASATTLILTGLSVAFAFRTGLFNIGATGQMLVGGLCATMVGLTLNLPEPLQLTVMFLAAAAGGALWGWLPGFLKAKFNVHEVVSTIMMNWIAYWLVYYTVKAWFVAKLETESALLPAASTLRLEWLKDLVGPGAGGVVGGFLDSYLNWGLLLALGLAAVVAVILNRTVLGFELKAVGFNRHSAEYAGMAVGRNIILSMVIAGALAGLAGFTFFCGYGTNMQIDRVPTQGFDGIAVALLGANSPFGVVAASLFFGLLHTGKGFMSAMTQIPPEIGDTIIAVIIYFAATSVLFERAWAWLRRRSQGGR